MKKSGGACLRLLWAAGFALLAGSALAQAPLAGSTWKYSFRDQQYRSAEQFYTVKATRVEGTRIVESFAVQDGEISQSTIEAGELRFNARPLGGGYSVLELAPYAPEILGQGTPGLTFMPTKYPRAVEWKVEAARRSPGEEITVPAGAFRVVRIEVTGTAAFAVPPSNHMVPTRFVYTAWYAPEINRYVKVRHQLWSRSAPVADEVAQLVEFRPGSGESSQTANEVPAEVPQAQASAAPGLTPAAPAEIRRPRPTRRQLRLEAVAAFAHPDYPLVHIYRVGAALEAHEATFYLNDVKVVELPARRFVAFRVPPGDYVMEQKWVSDAAALGQTLQVRAKWSPGQQYYYRLVGRGDPNVAPSVPISSIDYKWELLEMTPTQAREETARGARVHTVKPKDIEPLMKR